MGLALRLTSCCQDKWTSSTGNLPRKRHDITENIVESGIKHPNNQSIDCQNYTINETDTYFSDRQSEVPIRRGKQLFFRTPISLVNQLNPILLILEGILSPRQFFWVPIAWGSRFIKGVWDTNNDNNNNNKDFIYRGCTVGHAKSSLWASVKTFINNFMHIFILTNDAFKIQALLW